MALYSFLEEKFLARGVSPHRSPFFPPNTEKQSGRTIFFWKQNPPRCQKLRRSDELLTGFLSIANKR